MSTPPRPKRRATMLPPPAPSSRSPARHQFEHVARELPAKMRRHKAHITYLLKAAAARGRRTPRFVAIQVKHIRDVIGIQCAFVDKIISAAQPWLRSDRAYSHFREAIEAMRQAEWQAQAACESVATIYGIDGMPEIQSYFEQEHPFV